MEIQSTILYMTKHTIELISTRKMIKNDKGQCDIMND